MDGRGSLLACKDRRRYPRCHANVICTRLWTLLAVHGNAHVDSIRTIYFDPKAGKFFKLLKNDIDAGNTSRVAPSARQILPRPALEVVLRGGVFGPHCELLL